MNRPSRQYRQAPQVTAVAPSTVTRSPGSTLVTSRPASDHGAGEFVAEDDGRVVAEGVVHHVQVRAADAAEGYFHLDLARTADGFLHVEDIEVAFAGSEFDQSFHLRDDFRDSTLRASTNWCSSRASIPGESARVAAGVRARR